MNIKLQFKVERRLGDPTITVIIDDNMPSYTGVCPDQLELNVPVISGCHELRIQHYGKKTTDHVYDSSGKVIIDKHVEIKSIVLDEVELVEELWDGEFYPVYDQDYLKDCISANIKVPYSLRPNLYLGHNGTWIFMLTYTFTRNVEFFIFSVFFVSLVPLPGDATQEETPASYGKTPLALFDSVRTTKNVGRLKRECLHGQAS
jgi:hypothetical protein